MDNLSIIIYTDGACRGNPGIGSWAATLEYKNNKKEISGFSPHTTNNQMELTAVIESLKCIKVIPSQIVIHTDSQYVQKGMTEWITGWKRKNWRNVKNHTLWQELDSLASMHHVTWKWVRGHDGNRGNEYVDMLCNKVLDEHLSVVK